MSNSILLKAAGITAALTFISFGSLLSAQSIPEHTSSRLTNIAAVSMAEPTVNHNLLVEEEYAKYLIVNSQNTNWEGEETPEVSDLITRLGTLTEAQKDRFAGVALTFDRKGVFLFVADKNWRTSSPDVYALVSKHANLVKVINVKYSKAYLIDLTEKLLNKYGSEGITDIGPSLFTNTVEIGLKPDSKLQVLLNSKVRSSGDLLPISVNTRKAFQDFQGRYDDYERFFMGGKINNCSTGIPLIVDGKEGVITAGHCQDKTFKTPTGRFVGSQYTTAYPGNANRFGDWKIITGATYSAKVFNGPANTDSTSHLPIVGVSKREVGQSVCASGASTGQTCNYIINQTDKTIPGDQGVLSSHTSLMEHRQPGKPADCSGYSFGDSGGPVYSVSNTPGKVIAHGIIKGGNNDPSLGKCMYAFTQYNGVITWNPKIKFVHEN